MQRIRTIFFLSLIFLLLWLGYFHPLAAFDQDLGRHLLTGKIILETKQIPTTNLYSYTNTRFPFLNHHYGSEIVFYLIHTLTGNVGLINCMYLAITISFGLLIWYSYKKGYSPLLLALASLLYLPILFERTDIRPELFGFVCMSLYMIILFKNRQKPTHLLYLLPLMQLLWTNLHISFVIGVVVVTLFFIDACIVHHKNLTAAPVRSLFLILIATSIACLLTPFGIAGALYPLQIFHNYGYTIEENQSIFFLASIMQKSSIPYFQTTVVIFFIMLFSHYKKSRPIDWLLALTFSYLATSAIRHFPLFVFATFLSFLYYLTLSSNAVSSLFLPSLRKRLTMIFIVIVPLLFAWQAYTITQQKGIGMSLEESAKKAADFYLQNNIQGHVFNNFDIGSYLLYRIYPQQKVFVDGRPEAYPANFFQQIYIPMQQDPQQFKAIDNQYSFNAIFFSHTDQTPWGEQFLKDIVRNESWRIVYFDEAVIILLKNTPQNASLIADHAVTFKELSRIPTNVSMNTLLRRAHFFVAADLLPQGIPTFEAILKKEPQHCPSLYYLAQIYPQAPYGQQFQQVCK